MDIWRRNTLYGQGDFSARSRDLHKFRKQMNSGAVPAKQYALHKIINDCNVLQYVLGIEEATRICFLHNNDVSIFYF